MSKTPKRPRDPNHRAKRMVDIAAGEASDRAPTSEEQGKDAAAIVRGHPADYRAVNPARHP